MFIVFMGTNEMKTQYGFTVQEITDILLDSEIYPHFEDDMKEQIESKW